MGCDIHDYVEVRKNGKTWEYTGAIFPYAYHRPEEPSDVLSCYVPDNPEGNRHIKNYHPDHGLPCNEECYIDNPTKSDHPYKYRNYDLFAMLADVRNGRGFAGDKTGEGFNPICQPKGIPKDASFEVMRKFCIREDADHSRDVLRGWVERGMSTVVKLGPVMEVTHPDWHSASWLTVEELDAYDWNQETKLAGWVSPAGFTEFKEKGRPSSWCGGVGGGSIKHITNSEMERLLASGVNVSDDRVFYKYYTQVEWGIKYADSAREFLDVTMPMLRKLGAPKDVRMVFWFDN